MSDDFKPGVTITPVKDPETVWDPRFKFEKELDDHKALVESLLARIAFLEGAVTALREQVEGFSSMNVQRSKERGRDGR